MLEEDGAEEAGVICVVLARLRVLVSTGEETLDVVIIGSVLTERLGGTDMLDTVAVGRLKSEGVVGSEHA